MKIFVVFALCVAAASAYSIPSIVAGENAAEIQQIMDAINHPSTDPATADALEQMLLDILGVPKPVDVEPSPIQTIPEILDDSIVVEGGSAPIDASPAFIDESIYVEPANYPKPPPLVQIVINVNGNAAGNPVVVEQPPAPEVIPENSENEPEEVSVVEQPENVPEDVVIVEQPIIPDPVIVAPIVPSPVVTLPESLN